MSSGRISGTSTTRLLLLGVVRIFKQVNGYQAYRELMSWQVEEWAKVKPGSIYSGLRTLAKHGFLRVEEGEPDARGEPRTLYSLTPDGEKEFMTLLRHALWTVEPFRPEQFNAGLSFAPMLERDEVIAALESRVVQLEAQIKAASFDQRQILEDPWTPNHVVEQIKLVAARNDGELRWTRDLLQRISDGAYAFGGEPPDWVPPGD